MDLRNLVLIGYCAYPLWQYDPRTKWFVTDTLEDEMETLALGRTGLQVSELCLGTMFFGTTVDEATTFSLLDAFVEAGGNFIDTANCYSFWVNGGVGDESERVLGRWFRARGLRDTLIVATKVGARPRSPGAPWPEQKEGLTAPVIRTAVEDSLRRLQTEVIDLYYEHVEDRSVPLDEILEAFDRLIRDGKVRALGCSNLATWRIEQARTLSRRSGWAEFACAQMRYSYLRPRAGADLRPQVTVSEELLDYSAADGAFPILAYSPLLGGAFSQGDRPLPPEYRTRESENRLAALQEVAKETGSTPNQVVLAWMRQHPTPVIPLLGVSRVSQLIENLGSTETRLSPDQWRRLTVAGE